MPNVADQLSSLEWLAPGEFSSLSSAGIVTIGDLLRHVPKRYEDRRRFDSFPNQPADQAYCLRGWVIDVARRGAGGRSPWFQAVLHDGRDVVFGTGRIVCRWFNMPFLHRWIACGQELVVYGKLKEQRGVLVMDHPEFEVLEEDHDVGESPHLERIVPIYRNVVGIQQRRLREMVFALLQHESLEGVEVPLPSASFMAGLERVRMVHFPAELADAAAARRSFAFEECFAIQLNVAWRKRRQCLQQGRILGRKTGFLRDFYQSLPFDLTAAQKRSIREIVADMRRPVPMRRLLQGDVGAGKTLVALAAILLAVESDCQAVLMAPTQILAEQHYLTFCRYLDRLGIRVALRTASRAEQNWAAPPASAQVVIGTHSLLHEHALFQDVGLIVIDEQHKFGVSQRDALVLRGVSPDLLVMTATPIPRTLTLTLYGDLEVSVLDEKPPGRGRVVTALRVAPKQRDVTAFVTAQLAQGRQAYLVYPLVEESGNSQLESAMEAHRKWVKRLAPHRVGLLHGRMRPSEKESIMAEFRSGQMAALVSTTVIEVGVDVPNASVMILHHAERFGLAQLHQLRGRIGRGGNKGYCILLTDGKSPEAMEKLRVMESTSDGFEIAEADLRMRGPGALLGLEQSGLGQCNFAEFLGDVELLREARDMAEQVLDADPELSGPYACFAASLRGEFGQGLSS